MLISKLKLTFITNLTNFKEMNFIDKFSIYI